ncbi:MAG: CBS domain-containing protein [Acidovorax sp.]|uniref:CBS domain-containing protein n=1 Tax=Acidovorax sp. TaxID=1872122 RepID=UPI002613B5FB|nr:CBS domain-containing protein [Acidovorax sp.]MDH4427696.1 CBS domain-containing protein [Acidovorax sp.]MDH4447224.1 CBS domain-containing protein [Acidovorax sp.]
MFFVFGPSGQMFRGGPENLSRISAVRSVQRPQALRTRAQEREDPPFSGSSGALSPASAHAPARPSVNLRMQDAVNAYAQTEHGPQPARQPLTRVSDVMTVGGLSVPPDTRVNDAWQTLAENQVAQAPVVDALGRVIGLLLRADMAPLDLLPEPGAIKQAIELARRPVSEVMLSPVPTVAADTALRRVAAVLLDTGLPGLPVTDEAGVLAGFISRTDILRAVAADPPLDLWSGPATAL